ncbi:MAG: PilN domain-containing protein [Gammaproteobacteria bacterium]|nr:PilN domain-containing protein [Gammaproteobacteria bacterium]
MARINLLPWREELRKEKQKEFGFLMLGFVAVAALAVGSLHLYQNARIERQRDRNAYLEAEAVKLDAKIKEIEALTKERDRLIARMKAIEGLQRNRPLVVRFFDALVESLPEGVNVNQITQKGDKITIIGEAQSNARVSTFMRNLESSKWLQKPQLDVIQARSESGLRISTFTLKFSQVVPKAEGEEDT